MKFNKIQVIFTLLACTLVWSSPIVEEKTNTINVDRNIDEANKLFGHTNKKVVIKKKCDYGLDQFLESGGGGINEHLNFIYDYMGYNLTKLFKTAEELAQEFGCGYYFGRDYDMTPTTNLLVLANYPDHGYSSISSSDVNGVAQLFKTNNKNELEQLVKLFAIIYPVDGINEKGLSITLNSVLDGTLWKTFQNEPNKKTISHTTAVRLILDKAATVNEAIELLKSLNYDGSIQNVHYQISDTTGKSVAIEYYNDKMYITETPVLTNYYVSEDIPEGHNSEYPIDKRFNDLMKFYKAKPIMNYTEIKESMIAAKQDSQEAKTEWTVIYDTLNLEANYYRKLDYQHVYRIKLESKKSTENSPDEH
ncbi:hypothetical protein BCR32DRAFT_269356 [Anaeromyces robustus]|uniref:Choloylglycine hydrolase/NAAA C-terminal domain-containing protein n=1 Tax=Anaeromyces robustus TaxID=1754192 RepID=A0A1Y1X1Z1_9FUNG|nr:hypothetical protein BCR32DRAFT_269356 [Anaeromyces robustus]|eukprot:ORX79638.1 hypothetical protein BCR32DRAFT_269356 [Anaeromyces robustus]